MNGLPGRVYKVSKSKVPEEGEVCFGCSLSIWSVGDHGGGPRLQKADLNETHMPLNTDNLDFKCTKESG